MGTKFMLRCALAAALMSTASGLHGVPRPAEGGTQQTSAAAQASPGPSRMTEVIQAYGSEKKFMGCVLVVLGNDVLLNKGYGFANLEWDIPSTPSGKFRLGSITKQFTGTLPVHTCTFRSAIGRRLWIRRPYLLCSQLWSCKAAPR
jgi:CubicO group peptidase (beta-lactamase class C family)